MKKNDIKNDKNNNAESLAKVRLNWYPGHMAKTKKQIEQNLKLVDIIIEIIDSRIPLSSQNPDVKSIVGNKPKIVLLNKYDLADKKENELWVKYFASEGIDAFLTNCATGDGVNEAVRNIEKIMESKYSKFANQGRIGKKIRAMVLGIPNVGKSSFINRVSKSKALEVGNKPGVTKKEQWIRMNEKIELMDTPGVLWPKFDNEEVALNLSFTGTIKDEILPITEIGYQLVKFLVKNYPKNLMDRYKLQELYIEKIMSKNDAENIKIYEIMQEIGKKRGCIVSGGNIDDEKTAKVILDDFRSGKLGRITIERVIE